VFLSEEGAPAGKLRLIAMDHGHCFTCGTELTARAATIERVRDERRYGLFPEFRPLISAPAMRQCLADLALLPAETVGAIVDSIPGEWAVNGATREAIKRLVCDRAAHLSADPDAFCDRMLAA
jgi:hypothetical protein